MTGYAFPDMLVELDQLHRQGQREAAHDLFGAHLPLIRFEQQPGVGLAVRKYALMRRGAIASDVQRGPRVVLTQTGREEADFLLTRLARKDIRASSLA
jgi:4-hydroxy-tetrahydrodipicolinate synthase